MSSFKNYIIICFIMVFTIIFFDYLYSYKYSEGNKWEASDIPVEYKINTNNAPSGAINSILNSFDTWEDASNSWIRFDYEGTTSNNFTEDNVNSLSWGYAFGAIAASANWDYYPITEKDIVFESSYDWSTSSTCSSGYYDVQNIATHEIGHWLRLQDLYSSGDSEKTMYGYAAAEETKKRSLHTDDINGVRYIYEKIKVPEEFSCIQSALNSAFSGQTVIVSSGTYNEDNNITINSGIALNLAAGVTLRMASGKKLTVNGTLLASGTSSNRITFDAQSGTWYGTEVNSTGHFHPYYCNFDDAQYPIRYYDAEGSIERCNFEDYTKAVKFDNYADCDFMRYSTFIEYNTTGIEFTQYSGGSVRSYNAIQDNYYGVKIDNTSSPHLGSYAGQGYNSIYNLVWDVYSTNASSIMAQYNYWGGSDPLIYGNVTWEPALEDDPLGKRSARPAEKSMENIELSYADTVGFKEFDQAHLLYVAGQTDKALALFRELVNRYPDYNVGRQSLAYEYRILRKENRTSESTVRMLTVSNTYDGKEISGLANSIRVKLLLKNGDYNQGAFVAENVAAKFPGTNLEKYSLYDLGTIHWYYLGDQKSGEEYYRQLIEKYPDDDLSLSALATLGEWKPGTPEPQPGDDGIITTKLIANYPNPFNPDTHIKYSLKNAGNVKVIIYDMLGREIRTLVDAHQAAGIHELTWDGRDAAGVHVSSGMYVYQLQAGDIKLTKKMLLIK